MSYGGLPTTNGVRVLVLEDDVQLRSLLLRGLREEGFTAEGVGTGMEAIERVTGDWPDALIIDIGLPDSDGRDVCQTLRASGCSVPVLFLTGRSLLSDRLLGFSAGGDDYLTKPFAFEELVARVRVLARRGGQPSPTIAGALRLDPTRHSAASDDHEVMLTPTEFRLLARLAATNGEILRREILVQAAWPQGSIVNDNTLDAYVARLRRKLRTLPDVPEIVTVRHVGYSFR
jgi:two-component system, OmpR family, response regulator